VCRIQDRKILYWSIVFKGLYVFCHSGAKGDFLLSIPSQCVWHAENCFSILLLGQVKIQIHKNSLLLILFLCRST